MISVVNSFRQVLIAEADALRRAATAISESSISAAVDLLLEKNGKVVVSGVGKSAIIGHKIAETMCSTGTPAVFLHASDAMHGSLGLIGAGDVVIVLSNSGETDELISILPAVRQRGAKIIAIVGNSSSTVAQSADVVLAAEVDREACPLNLAPTTSTTLALAVGDALAVALMESAGLTAEDFALNHPSGRLGKRLTMRVADLMQKSPEVAPHANWLEVVRAISSFALGAVNVVEDGKLIGIVTDGDLRRTIERTPSTQIDSLTARDMMTVRPITTSAETLAFEALQQMENRPSQISVLPVVDQTGAAVGLLRLHDIVRSGL